MAVTLAVPASAQSGAPFDDLGDGSAVPPNYGAPGLVWTNWAVVNGETDPRPHTAGCIVSDPNCAFNGSGAMASITSASPFTFNSGYFMGWYNSYNGGYGGPVSLTVNGYFGASLIGSQTLNLDPARAQLYNFDYANVDRVDFITDTDGNGTGVWYLADNLTFNTTATPEPASLILLATGLGAIGLVRRKVLKR